MAFGRPIGSNGEVLPAVPHCPRCDSENGSLGTQNAYFLCRDCGREQYWTDDNQHPVDWALAVKLSPYGHDGKHPNCDRCGTLRPRLAHNFHVDAGVFTEDR